MNYEALKRRAYNQIAGSGLSVVIRRFEQSKNFVTGKNDDIVCQDQPGKALAKKLGSTDSRNLEHRFSEALRSNKVKKLVVAAYGLVFVPEPGHFLRFGSTDWEVIGVSPLSPGGIDLLYDVFVQASAFSQTQSDALEVSEFTTYSRAFNRLINTDLPFLL